jgi:hypothetical protein
MKISRIMSHLNSGILVEKSPKIQKTLTIKKVNKITRSKGNVRDPNISVILKIGDAGSVKRYRFLPSIQFITVMSKGS